MKRAAFTLIELLVVVTIIILLVAILMPALSRARALTRCALCQHNLHQIGQAFHAAAGVDRPGQGARPTYPSGGAWPGVPMNALGDQRIYQCPERPVGASSLGDYQLYVHHVDAYINLEEGPYCQVTETGDYTRYAFEEYTSPDWNDVVFHVSAGPPRTLTLMPWFDGRSHTARWDSLRVRGEDVPGWEDIRQVPLYTKILLGGAATNYGINAKIHHYEVSPDTVVVLDYDRLVANNGEDMPELLGASARHLGRLNVLKADESVVRMGPSELDPDLSDDIADLWSP